ncbi:hypothetical protein [Kribbella flavida]|uniref:hypothetical protein n=1 Tax=Kribbella flavida TaxID=182640 RepID=UPI00059C5B5C|nr:hypothetical protein [Kribbella flavida]
MFSLALALTGDRVRAEGVVVDVISAACSMLSLPDVELRHELSRRTYRRCTAAGPGHASTVGTEEGRQRAALSLVRFGGLDYCETAAVLGLPSPEVARLLNSGLHELVLTPEHPRP